MSQEVGDQMDESTDVATDFTQTIDFSKATSSDPALTVFFSKPESLKEVWAVSKDSNISLTATQGATQTKRVYIKSENATYVYSDATKAWVKTEGSQLSPASIFYPVDPRGSLFYLSKVESFEDLGSETVSDISAKKLKIVLKKSTVQELLTAANPALAKIKYTDVIIDDLEVLAWIDENNQIVKVTVAGDVEVTSDLYNGPVTIKADGTYKYQAQTVAKP